MNSKEALDFLNGLISREKHIDSERNKKINDCYNLIKKDLKRLEKYKSIEKELGIVFNINKQLNTKKEIWFKIKDEIEENFRFDSYYIIDLKHKAFVKIKYEPLDYLYFKDYGKTWALTKEELENDN